MTGNASGPSGSVAGCKQEDLAQFFAAYGSRRCAGMWKPFRQPTGEHAPQAEIVFDKFHILRHLNDALDEVRRAEYARVQGDKRRFIKAVATPCCRTGTT